MLQVAYCGHGRRVDPRRGRRSRGARRWPGGWASVTSAGTGGRSTTSPTGQFRARTKAGNHNAWRAEHEHDYDVVAQMDPDHVPLPYFLERTLGYFRDPDVAFVVAPQVYGNMYDNWIAHGASVQQYLFSGIIERGGNGLDAPLLIGTNHLYRPAAWAQIGGYQDSIIEDHLTEHAGAGAVNPATGRRWKGVYTPDVIAVGEGPTSWADYFNQQKRWAYGIWEILLRRAAACGGACRARHSGCSTACVQFYYPSVAVTLLLGNVATALYLLFGSRVDPAAQPDLAGPVVGRACGSWFAAVVLAAPVQPRRARARRGRHARHGPGAVRRAGLPRRRPSPRSCAGRWPTR